MTSERDLYSLKSETRRIDAKGYVSGTITVKQRGTRRVHKVHYSNSENGWQQWGAVQSVLYFTVPIVERLCGQDT